MNNKYPKTIYGTDCIGPCVQPNIPIIHPITLNTFNSIAGDNNSYCPINMTTNTNIIQENINTGYEPYYIDKFAKCIYIDNNTNNTSNIDSIILPDINITKKILLNDYYKIYSISDAIYWINNNNNNSVNTTKIKILNYAWKYYGNNIDNIEYTMLYYYNKIIHNKWIKVYYKKLYNKMDFIDNKITILKNIDTNININDNKKEKILYLLNKKFNIDQIYKYISMFIIKYKNKWDKINDYNKKIKKFILIKIKNDIIN